MRLTAHSEAKPWPISVPERTIFKEATFVVKPAPMVSLTPPASVFPYDEVNPSMTFTIN